MGLLSEDGRGLFGGMLVTGTPHPMTSFVPLHVFKVGVFHMGKLRPERGARLPRVTPWICLARQSGLPQSVPAAFLSSLPDRLGVKQRALRSEGSQSCALSCIPGPAGSIQQTWREPRAGAQEELLRA